MALNALLHTVKLEPLGGGLGGGLGGRDGGSGTVDGGGDGGGGGDGLGGGEGGSGAPAHDAPVTVYCMVEVHDEPA